MRTDEIQVGQSYLMNDGRVLRVVHQWTAEDGHERVRFAVIKGEAGDAADMSLRHFAERAERDAN